MSAAFDFFPVRARYAAAAFALAVATTAAAQNAADAGPAQPNSTSALRLPENPQIFGAAMPSVVKATAIVNGEVITQTDVDQRLALLAIANDGKLPTDQMEALRQQVLRNLIDESLQIQAAKAAEIKVTDKDIDRTLERVAGNVKMNSAQLGDYLKNNNSSVRSLRRQIQGEIAWRRLQQQKIESSVNVGDEEVKAVLERLNAAKGTQEYKVGEIFLSASPATMQQAMANAGKIIEQLRQGASFAGYARQYSEASTAAVGGDLGWVRPEQLPDQLSNVLRQMNTGQVSAPIPVPGGVSIIAVLDSRKILGADPRNAVLSLKQVSITFPAGTTRPQAEARVAKFAEAARNVGGCGGADKIAAEFNGEVVQSDQIRLRDLPPALQEIMLPLQVGQATRPFGSIEEGVRTLVICGRDEADASAPTFDQVYNQISEERVNTRARRYLRDLRRDAVIEFR
ncbi:peptidylprolyl isomerase [Sphingomonas sp. SM33]|uniref:Parvulin-like PPIase n=1 Tax=Sphingomonas telluris TaxID=2907998 RepID=A0ABS9VJU7_9SPHN|nr:peptidylprolyl isomerase [Sphingomonas telluris]